LGSDDPAGLCPKCLMQGVFDSSFGGNDSGIETVDTVTAGVSDDDFGRYHILRPLGEGGMGTVYLAEQREPIRRLVALKVVKLGMDTGQVLARFANERQALAIMDHPSIARIFDAGATPKGRPYFVMEYIEGMPITQYCDRRRMTIGQRLEVFLSVCRAVQHAHQKGVIHRDLKPSNVLVMEQEEKPVAKVIDFGIAKATDQWAVEKTLLTQFGQMVGTPEYASPEQAEVMTGEVDERSDVYSLGVILYELLIGVVPFDPTKLRQEGLAEMLRIVREEEAPSLSRKLSAIGAATADIASQRQTDPASLRRLVDGDLNWITVKALEKARERRYASVAELGSDIERYVEHRPVLASPPSGLYRARKFVRRHRPAVFGAAAGLVFIAFAGLTVWSFVHRNTSSRPKLTDRDTIVLADFTNTTGDPVFDGTLRQGLSVQLEQSPFLSIVSEQQIQQTLQMMGQKPDAKLTPEIARQLCQRTASAAVLNGSIAQIGNPYLLTVKAVNCSNGATLASTEAQASDKNHVLDALGKTASDIRNKLGESLSTVQKFDTPLEEATTPSLEALKAFSSGKRATSPPVAITFYKRAVELDPNFAVAYAWLGIWHTSIGEPTIAARYTRKAYELRERASEPERYFVSAIYYKEVLGNLEKAEQSGKLWMQAYPRSEAPHTYLSGAIYPAIGRYDGVIAEAKEAIRLNPNYPAPYVFLMDGYIALNRFDEANTAYRQAVERKMYHHYYPASLYHLAFLQNDEAGMKQQVTVSAGQTGVENTLLAYDSDTSAYYGRVRESEELTRRAMESAERFDEKEISANYSATSGLREALFGNAGEARRRASVAVAHSTGVDVLYASALASAYNGDTGRAETLIKELNKRFPEGTTVQFNYLPTIRAKLALNRGDSSGALETLQAALPYELGTTTFSGEYTWNGLYPAFVRGEAYLAAHQGNEATAEFLKILDHRGIVWNSPIGALARLQLGRAYAMVGDSSKARVAYKDFLTLWKDADPDIPILKQAKAEYAKLQ
jgi:eukaryotic-like serine/threonine-protein kinase